MLFFQDVCAVCTQPGPSPCRDCEAKLLPPPPLAIPEGIDTFSALFAYEGTGKDLIGAFKFKNQRSTISWMADGLANGLSHHGAQAITWVPSSVEGRRHRGFDTGEMIARLVARRLKIRAVGLLERTDKIHQSVRNEADRHLGPGIRLRPHFARTMTYTRLILVDDVCTSGVSLQNAAESLRNFGVRQIHGAVAARTPRLTSLQELRPRFGGS